MVVSDVLLDLANEMATVPQPVKKKLGKVYCSFGHTNEANWVIPLGFELTSNIREADVVVFGGGKDVDPGFYGEKRGRNTCTPNERDRREREDFELIQALNEASKDGKKILSVGVCRGAQLICALSGGKLIQDVSGHSGTHSIDTFDKKEFKVNSIHHQMLFPYNLKKIKEYKILGWSKNNLSGRYLDGFGREKWLPQEFKEIEVAYFPKTHGLGIQSHPEMMIHSSSYEETVKWMQDLMLKAFYNQI